MLTIAENEIIKNWNSHDIPLVSIKCLTYNHEKYISQALDGFLMQKTDFPFEIVVHDDASTDKTAEIVREYEKKYPNIIKPIYELENQYSKPGISINDIIFPYLKGKYIAICEGDDYWIDENKLQMQVDFLENNPEYGMCFHNALKYDYTNNRKFMFNDENFKELTLKNLILEWHIPTASIVLLREVMDKKMPAKGEYPQGDILFHLAGFDFGKIYYFPQIMSVYRYNVVGSATSRSNADPLKYLKGNSLLWNDLDSFYDYKYHYYIKKKIRYNNFQIFKQKCLKHFVIFRIIKKIYRMIKKEC